nr:transporter substrate-binding domain-containing protein [uncultured Pseudomonas sp.]
MTTAQFTLIAILLLGMSSTGVAQGIKVVTEDTSYSYLQDGKVAGTATAVVEATLQRAGLNDYSVTIYPWARAYDMALQEKNVLIYLIARTPEREALFKWVGEIEHIDYPMYKLRERSDIQVRDLQEAKHYSVGVVRDDVRHQYLKEQGFTKLVVSANNRDNFKRLLNRQVQLVPMPESDVAMQCLDAQFDCARLEKTFTPELTTSLYMAYSLSTDDEIVARTREAFDNLKTEGTVQQLIHGDH